MEKVLIAVPMLSTVCAEFFTSMMRIQTEGTAEMGIEINTLVYEARNKLTLKAIEKKCDYIWWIDSDMTFEPDILLRLLEDARKGYEYISALCFRRQYPTKPVICKSIQWEIDQKTGEVLHDAEIYEDYPRDSFFEIAASGMGSVLMSTKLITDVAAHFRCSPFAPLPSYGEDYSFCWRVKQLGRKMYCDSKIKCGHVGTFIFGENIYLSQGGANGR